MEYLINETPPSKTDIIKSIKFFQSFFKTTKHHKLGSMPNGSNLSMDHENVFINTNIVNLEQYNILELSEIVFMIEKNMEKILQDDYDEYIQSKELFFRVKQAIENLTKKPEEIQKKNEESVAKAGPIPIS